MIYTVTFNPSSDPLYSLRRFSMKRDASSFKISFSPPSMARSMRVVRGIALSFKTPSSSIRA